MDSRTALRKPLLQQRQSLSTEAGTDAALGLLHNLQNFLHTAPTALLSETSTPLLRVAGYLAVKGEIDPAPALLWLREHGHKTYLPVVRPDQRGRLLFAPLTNNTRFETGSFQIPVPVFEESDLLNNDLLDLVLVPLVGFDRNGNRLGMGGGFYDRTFSHKLTANPSHHGDTRPFLLGVAHEFQLLEQVPAESWDVPLDAVITNQAIYDFD